MWGGAVKDIPHGWALCDGNDGRPNLMDKFIAGAGFSYPPGTTGGYFNACLPTHNHGGGGTGTTSEGGAHTHTYQGSNYQPNNAAGSQPDWIGTSTMTTAEAGAHTHSFTMELTTDGEDPTGKNLPPFYALCYIIKLDPALTPTKITITSEASTTQPRTVTLRTDVLTAGVYYLGDAVQRGTETAEPTQDGSLVHTYPEGATYVIRFVSAFGDTTSEAVVVQEQPLVISATNAPDYVVNFTVAPAVSGTFYMGDAVAAIPEVPAVPEIPEVLDPDTGEVIQPYVPGVDAIPEVPAIPETVIESTDGVLSHTFRDGSSYTVTYSRPDIALYPTGTVGVTPISRLPVTLTATTSPDTSYLVTFGVSPDLAGTYSYGNPDGTTGTDPSFTYPDATEVTVTFSPDDTATYVSSTATTVTPTEIVPPEPPPEVI